MYSGSRMFGGICCTSQHKFTPKVKEALRIGFTLNWARIRHAKMRKRTASRLQRNTCSRGTGETTLSGNRQVPFRVHVFFKSAIVWKHFFECLAGKRIFAENLRHEGQGQVTGVLKRNNCGGRVPPAETVILKNPSDKDLRKQLRGVWGDQIIWNDRSLTNFAGSPAQDPIRENLEIKVAYLILWAWCKYLWDPVILSWRFYFESTSDLKISSPHHLPIEMLVNILPVEVRILRFASKLCNLFHKDLRTIERERKMTGTCKEDEGKWKEHEKNMKRGEKHKGWVRRRFSTLWLSFLCFFF